jgi:hypothetical protein
VNVSRLLKLVVYQVIYYQSAKIVNITSDALDVKRQFISETIGLILKQKNVTQLSQWLQIIDAHFAIKILILGSKLGGNILQWRVAPTITEATDS